MIFKILTHPTMNLFKYRRLYIQMSDNYLARLTNINNFFDNRTNKSWICLFGTVKLFIVFYIAYKVSIIILWIAALLEKCGERDRWSHITAFDTRSIIKHSVILHHYPLPSISEYNTIILNFKVAIHTEDSLYKRKR